MKVDSAYSKCSTNRMAILDSWAGSAEFKFENLPSKDHLSNYEKYVTDI